MNVVSWFTPLNCNVIWSKITCSNFCRISDWDGFILDEQQLIPTATETWAGVRVVADAVIERINKTRSPKNEETGEKIIFPIVPGEIGNFFGFICT